MGGSSIELHVCKMLHRSLQLLSCQASDGFFESFVLTLVHCQHQMVCLEFGVDDSADNNPRIFVSDPDLILEAISGANGLY